jgi:ribosomal protein S18 acetylase RimI-like enzyme
MSPGSPSLDASTPGIRRYELRDRTAVRTLCCDTADGGGPVEHFFPDREVFADLVCRYYTDYEPASSWVAEDGGQIAGYLNGCLDTHRFERTMALRVLPRLIAKVLLRGTLLRAQTRRFIALNVPLWMRRTTTDPAERSPYPAHFHINLAPAFRARHVGAELVEPFLARLQGANIPGVHVNVREDNARARAFFERLGFVALARHPFMRMPDQPDVVLHSIRYGKRF